MTLLPRLRNLRGVTFDWSDRYATAEASPDRRQIGVIAQEVEAEFPELVSTTVDGYRGVDYGRLSAVLLQAVREQQREIEALKAEMARLRDAGR